MRKFWSGSFRRRLFWAFLAAAMVPLLLCAGSLLQIFRLRLNDAARTEAQAHLNSALYAVETAYDGFARAAERLAGEDVVTAALAGSQEDSAQVYNSLFQAVQEVRSYARVDLYDGQGRCRYSTQAAPAERTLPVNWGVLRAARQAGGLRFVACEDVNAQGEPLLQGAAPLYGPEGGLDGYLVVSLYQSGLRQLVAGKYGVQNSLLVVDRFWQPVYCDQPSQAAARAARLRQHLLAGGDLETAEEDFICTAAQQPDTGLYLILQRPQVFNRNTLDLLYTVSLGCAALGVLICVGLSWKLSRQMFRPIQHLHSAIQAVGQNDLNVRVQLDQDDELGELAKRFDGMVAALKHNQEQLVENQRELNQAQIRMLQAQLNPHFLCNTLDTMKWISKINQVPQVAVMSTDLADILRFCISPEEFVPLRRESEILQRYMEIQHIRMSGAISFRLDLPEELADCLTPKMILQPLVENAVLHGVDGAEHGEIWVRARETGGKLQIQVLDNGRGLPEELLGPYACRDRELSRGHLGLYNVDTILIKYYGKGFGLYLENRTDGPGAVVTATLPIRREEKAQC